MTVLGLVEGSPRQIPERTPLQMFEALYLQCLI